VQGLRIGLERRMGRCHDARDQHVDDALDHGAVVAFVLFGFDERIEEHQLDGFLRDVADVLERA
jgi:hypothetical protein